MLPWIYLCAWGGLGVDPAHSQTVHIQRRHEHTRKLKLACLQFTGVVSAASVWTRGCAPSAGVNPLNEHLFLYLHLSLFSYKHTHTHIYIYTVYWVNP